MKMEMFVEALARIHTDRDVFIRQITLIPHFGHVVLYDAGDEPWVGNIVAETVKWAHPVDFNPNEKPAPVGLGENIGSCEPSPDVRPPQWDKTQGTWFTDVDKVGRYSVKRPAKRAPYQAYLNGKDLGLMPDSDPEVLKRSINRRILAGELFKAS